NGETEKQVFRFTDNGGRDIALRFDLTVPFARFIAEHYNELYFPFKRYHIAKVWRGEKPQAGRYREFIQCDFDTIGSDCAYTDFEILYVMCKALQAIGISRFTIHLSHRNIFNRFLKRLDLSSKSEDVLRIVDKLAKVGAEVVSTMLAEITTAEKAAAILQYCAGVSGTAGFERVLEHVEQLAGGQAEDTERVREVYQLLTSADIAQYVLFDPSITRGLDYYTGMVYETFLTDVPQLGSVCSGGRYDNLTGLYMKHTVSGVGASIGLDRLLAGLEQLHAEKECVSFIDVLIFCESTSTMRVHALVCEYLRSKNIRVEAFPEPKKMQVQYAYAEKKHIRWGMFIDSNVCNTEQNSKDHTAAPHAVEQVQIRLKHLATRQEHVIALHDAASIVRQ
ncbi:MAG: histidine--tRNA ligase, partial [Treponema sp.]